MCATLYPGLYDEVFCEDEADSGITAALAWQITMARALVSHPPSDAETQGVARFHAVAHMKQAIAILTQDNPQDDSWETRAPGIVDFLLS